MLEIEINHDKLFACWNANERTGVVAPQCPHSVFVRFGVFESVRTCGAFIGEAWKASDPLFRESQSGL
jgi:hypothetical protein